jgi:tRNA(fMet)-specific endonuclease VapC
MGALIDTSLLVESERGRFDFAAWFEDHGDETFAISAITLSELWHGVHRASPGRRREDREAFVQWVTDELPVVPFDSVVARVHARIWADLASRGAMLGAHDLIVAATAVAGDLKLATFNAREFERVPDLRLLRLPS